ncbi:hypothetical protein [Nocardia bovistercoris]|uniref:Uncharacterized protein n=1 Tax=Nocardia bovistercoris TaxID=2785916 RepID=A0A931I9W6_9NOCA|nr:hypothetical protein [Nocardia bovistercoris]MBH0776578.1 hypothetical protein [Nocardia bovistercoris]
MTGQQAVTRCRDATGNLREYSFVTGDEVSSGALAARLLFDEHRRVYLGKYVPSLHRSPELLALLDNEIRALTRFALVFGAQRYPRWLPRLVGYDVSVPEPFVILTAPPGEAAAAMVRELDSGARQRMWTGMLRAVQCTAAAGVVHNNVGLSSLWWDGDCATLCDFEYSHLSRVGDTGGDIRAAGLVIAASAGVDSATPEVRKLLWHSETGGEHRRTATDMLADLGVHGDIAHRDPELDLLPGRELFDRIRVDKHRGAKVDAKADRRARIRSILRSGRADGSGTPATPTVTCPYCWDTVLWEDDGQVWLFRDDQRDPAQIDVTALAPAKQADLRRRGFRPCPNPSDDVGAHFLPATYGSYADPLPIAMIGAPESGKTHLLAAMVQAVHAGGLAPYGLSVQSLDLRRHTRFRGQQIERLESGAALDSTDPGARGYVEMLVLRRIHDGAARVVTLFDIAGEDLRNADDRGSGPSRFLIGGPALLFTHAVEDPPATGGFATESENRAFQVALAKIRAVSRSKDLPAALALTKADRLRYVPPVDRWLNRPPSGRTDAEAMLAESRDIYAYLHARGATAALTPVQEFTRFTLHAVSASGGDANVDAARRIQVFPRGFQPMRVLEPLVAILAMAGVIDGPEAAKVGRP